PELAAERVGVLQRDATAVGAADMRQDQLALDRIVADEFGDRRMGARRRIVEGSAARAFIEGDSPTVLMGARMAAPSQQPREAETDIRGHAGAHAHQLAHRSRSARIAGAFEIDSPTGRANLPVGDQMQRYAAVMPSSTPAARISASIRASEPLVS